MILTEILTNSIWCNKQLIKYLEASI